MNTNDLEMRKTTGISPMREIPDDLFITCGSFEERCLGAPRKILGDLADRIVLFRFTERNDKREILIEEMEKLLHVGEHRNRYERIPAEHGNTLKSVLLFHKFCVTSRFLKSKNLFVTLDITTFTRSLLLELLFYLKTFLPMERLRLIYTVPREYAHPEEGELSYGIKSIQILPSFWRDWSTLKDDLLLVILGYEEMRAWSLINQFDANVNLLLITNPGSIYKWNSHCEKYNDRLLKDIPAIDSVPALDPNETARVLAKHVTLQTSKKHNIFISPLGTKPQMVGVFHFSRTHPDVPVNIITTTPIDHNIPYYSWGIGETFEFFLPLEEPMRAHL